MELVSREQLREKSVYVNYKESKEEIHKLISEMRVFMSKRSNCSGLAAPQVGYKVRVILCKIKGGIVALINPTVSKLSGSCAKKEGCISIEKCYKVKRATVGTVTYTNEAGNRVSIVLAGQELRRVLHEIDHLDGVCIDDIGEVL